MSAEHWIAVGLVIVAGLMWMLRDDDTRGKRE